MYRKATYLSAALLSVLALACDAPPTQVEPGSGPVGTVTQPIINGEPPNAPMHEAVVGLHMLQGSMVYVKPFCSGTLIREDVVLTAAHCLDDARGGPKFKTLSPGKVAVYVGDDPSVDLLNHLYEVSDTEIQPGYDRLALRNDLGLLRLTQAVTEVAPVDALPQALGLDNGDIGATINFAGFGDDENGEYGVKLQADGTIDGFGCASPGCGDPADPATQFSYQQQEAGPCFGDSGGPAFLMREGVPYVAGLTSYGDSGCAVYGVSTRTDAYEGYIDGFISGGDPGDPGDNDCGNGVCDADESCDGRNDTVDCPSDCPGKTTGKPTLRWCTVGDTCEGGGCP